MNDPKEWVSDLSIIYSSLFCNSSSIKTYLKELLLFKYSLVSFYVNYLLLNLSKNIFDLFNFLSLKCEFFSIL